MATDSRLSAQKLAANRKNAQRSTGPRTAAGKAASARNATTLGLFTKRDYVRRSERAEYQALGDRYFVELRPEGVLEETLVVAIVSAAWRLRRCSMVEYNLAADSSLDPMQHGYNREPQNSVDRARSQSSLLLRRSLLELRRVQTDRFLIQKLLAQETGLPAFAVPKQIVTVINQHNSGRAKANNSNKYKDSTSHSTPPATPSSVASICRIESVRPHTQHNRAQTPRNGQCPCGSGEKFKRCCGKEAPPVLGPALTKRQNPRQAA